MSFNSDIIIWAMLFFIVIIILGLYYSEFTPLDLNEKKKIIDMNQFVENFTSQSSSSDQAEGASQTYDRDDNSKPISFSIPEPHFDFDFGFDKDDKCHPKHKQYNEHECIPDPKNSPNHNKENINEICRRCDITMNNNINKYVLKNSVPPCPDMSDYATKNMINYTPDLNKYILKSEIKPCDKVNISDYIKKSEIPACPNCPICPTCPICPICPEQKQCKEIYQYNIAEHPDISKYVLKSEMEKALEKCKKDKPSCPKVEEQKPCPKVEEHKICPTCPSCPKVEEQKSCPICKNNTKIGDDEEERKKRNSPKEEEERRKINLHKDEDKYKQYINHLYEEEKVMGYYAGDNLFARV